jgi:hypothetical protein
MDLLEIYLHRGWRLKNLTVETLRQSLCFGVSDAQWAASLPTVQANVEFILRHREMVSSEFIHEVITPITMQSLYRLTERSFQVSKLNVAKSKAKRQLRKQRGGAYWASRGFWLCCCSKKPRLN